MEDYRSKWILLKNTQDQTLSVKRSIQNTRYHPDGQKRIKRKIFDRLGHYPAQGGILITPTIAPPDNKTGRYKGMFRLNAWDSFGYKTRHFMDEINKWRKRHGLSKVKRFIRVMEDQPDRHYPCPHIWFPGLKWLAPIDVIQGLWPYGDVDLEYRDQTSPATYITKYITKMQGKDFMQAMMWRFALRLFSTSRDFRYAVPEPTSQKWSFHAAGGQSRIKEAVDMLVADGWHCPPSVPGIARGG